jgi:integrase
MAKRRGNHEGSVSRTKSGRWRAQVTLQGKRLSHTTDTQREAQEWIRKIRGQIDQGLTYSGAIRTVGEFVEGYLDNKRDCLRSHSPNFAMSHSLYSICDESTNY